MKYVKTFLQRAKALGSQETFKAFREFFFGSWPAFASLMTGLAQLAWEFMDRVGSGIVFVVYGVAGIYMHYRNVKSKKGEEE